MPIGYQTIIGLEVHVELATVSKMFCGCSAEHFGVEPNTHTCPVCLGLPGALPVPNKKAIDWTLMLAMALDCRINQHSHFDRKNYFYPDLPKGYQITQFEEPFGYDGCLKLTAIKSALMSTVSQQKVIRIRRVHLEEDTGKLQHTEIGGEKVTLVDFNRSGVPLVEIVTEPDFRSLEEVDLYLKKLQKIIRYLGISQADMEKGSMRIEPSISIRVNKNNGQIQFPMPNDQLPDYRVELKNINSFRFARKALEYEIKRQTDLLEKGEKIPQQTRGWNEEKNVTFPQREKEEAHDYRYFPEPDIPPIVLDNEQLAIIKKQIPELPDQKLVRFQRDYSLSDYDAGILTENQELGDYFEEAVKAAGEIGQLKTGNIVKTIANWLINKRIETENTLPAELIAKIIRANTIAAVDEGKLSGIVKEVLGANKQAVNDYQKGKKTALGFLMGAVIKLLPGVDKELIRKELEKQLF